MFEIRQATIKDIDAIAKLEAMCFPEAEAASLGTFEKRFAIFPECFFVLEVEGIVVGQINGCIYDEPELPDALYANANLHNPDGDYQTVFGLTVDPLHQNRGFASALTKHLIQTAQNNGRKGVVLTCKDPLVNFYLNLGFSHQGVSDSSHGGAH